MSKKQRKEIKYSKVNLAKSGMKNTFLTVNLINHKVLESDSL